MEESNYFYDLLSLRSYISVGSLAQGGTTRSELDPSISVISQKLKMVHSLPVGQSDGILSIGFLPSQMTLLCQVVKNLTNTLSFLKYFFIIG